jgi:hypothetical protein
MNEKLGAFTTVSLNPQDFPVLFQLLSAHCQKHDWLAVQKASGEDSVRF